MKKSRKDPKLKELSQLFNGMISGKVGSGIYKENGEVKYTAYSPVKGTNWVLSVTKSERTGDEYKRDCRKA